MLTLLRIELFKIFKRPRTYISFVAIAAMVSIVHIALKFDGRSYVEFLMGGLKDSIEVPYDVVLNGYLVCFIILNLLLIHVPLLVTLVAGDAVAGEANMGTLRLLLTRPVSRTQFMLTKFAACVIYTIILLAWMALLSLLLSIVIFGTNDMIITRNDVVEQLQRNDILWRYLAAFAYAAVALTTVAALAFLLSVFADNSIGPIVSTISIVIVFTILSEMQIPIYDDTIKPWLFTSNMLAWKGFFYSKSNGEGQAIKGSIENLFAIMKSLGVLLSYIVLFVGLAVFCFQKERHFILNLRYMMRVVLGAVCVCCFLVFGHAQEASVLVSKVKAKIEQVRDYEATGIMKTNVPFLKVPVADVIIFFKRPDKMKIKNEKGISLVPKGAVSMSLSNLMSGKDFTAIPAGEEKINGVTVKVIKLLPMDNNADVVLSTLYIDEERLLIMKAVTTTRENGTFELSMEYGKFAGYALPRKAIFSFNTREYKLPKGVTFDYDDGSRKKKNNDQLNNNKGHLEITYSDYIINRGVPDTVFQ